MSRIYPVTMPKWGLSMQEGKVNRWLVDVGDSLQAGAEVVEVESDKIAGVIEAAGGGVLRRRIAKEDDVLPVGALLALISDKEAESHITRQNCRSGQTHSRALGRKRPHHACCARFFSRGRRSYSAKCRSYGAHGSGQRS